MDYVFPRRRYLDSKSMCHRLVSPELMGIKGKQSAEAGSFSTQVWDT
jgi:hypothetical protein